MRISCARGASAFGGECWGCGMEFREELGKTQFLLNPSSLNPSYK
jgi:hypothetical protein